MNRRYCRWLPLVCAVLLLIASDRQPAAACCPVVPPDKSVVNASQTIVILWDAEKHIEHFIRKATFQSDADDLGFLVPSPAKPDLSESGGEAFPLLTGYTAPEIVTETVYTHSKYDCTFSSYGSANKSTAEAAPMGSGYPLPVPEVRVLEEKDVAGFHAAVLDADTTGVLLNWLKTNGYAFSPAVEGWAAPYVTGHWKITALKVVKDPTKKNIQGVAAKALRISFATDRPLFPYREPDFGDAPQKLQVHDRLLRIYFLGEARYQGEITPEQPWTGQAVWSNPLATDKRTALLQHLGLPADAGPQTLWLTEFEDHWPYRKAAADLYFAKDQNQATLKRPPIVQYVYVEDWPNWLPLVGIALLIVAITAGAYARTRRKPGR